MRKIPLMASEAPATARPTSARGSDAVSPKSVMPSPQHVAARITPHPCRCTREVQPLVTTASALPAAIADQSTPSTTGPPSPAAMAGKSADGIPKNIATMSVM